MPTSPPVHCFFDFILDPVRVQLRRGHEGLELRPKTYAVLRYLVEHPGRLVTKQELLAAVWPDTVVTEWVLTSCIKELRQVLGDDSRRSRIIQTAHRRGYRFIAPVGVGSRDALGAHKDPPALAEVRDGRLVGRDAELGQIAAWLHEATARRRQIGFVVGGAGIGKTTLIDTFLSDLEARGDRLWIARGQAVEQHGAAEPYLPVLDALGRLCAGTASSERIMLLRHQAPSWLVQLPGLIEAEEAEALARRLGPGNRSRMLRELASFIEALAVPLVLVLEDLHWSDHATLDLLAMLAQRRDPAQLLLLATYRPVEVAVREHPLKDIHHELRARGLCRDLWLEPLGEAAVADYLARRWPGLVELPALAHEMCLRTDGNPLFLVNVADALEADGLVQAANERWTLCGDVMAGGARVPAGLRQMIAAQNERLAPSERELLAAGSLAGRSFSAALVAAALDHDLLAVEAGLERLAQHRQIVQTAGESRWPDGTVAGVYRFAHALYQNVLSEQVPPAQRRHLHGRIAARLEAAYGQGRREVAAELAFHFEAGGQAERAVPYIEAASDRALQLGSGHEAVVLLQNGIDMLDALPATPERTQHVVQLCLQLGRALPVTQGFVQPAIETSYDRARRLSEETGDLPALIQALAGLATIYLSRADFIRACEAAEAIRELKDRMPLPGFVFASHFFNGLIRYHTGSLQEARAQFEAALAVENLSFPTFSSDPRAAALSYLDITLLELGYPDRAQRQIRASLGTSRPTWGPFSRVVPLHLACWAAIMLRDDAMLAQLAQEAAALGLEHDIPSATSVAAVAQGTLRAHEGDPKGGVAMIRSGVAFYRERGQLVTLARFLGSLTNTLIEVGDLDAAQTVLGELRALATTTGEQRVVPELNYLSGEVQLRQGDHEGARRHLLHAVEVARARDARWLELRATVGLVRLMLHPTARATDRRTWRTALARLLEGFTEGNDHPDLQEAHELLATR